MGVQYNYLRGGVLLLATMRQVDWMVWHDCDSSTGDRSTLLDRGTEGFNTRAPNKRAGHAKPSRLSLAAAHFESTFLFMQ